MSERKEGRESKVIDVADLGQEERDALSVVSEPMLSAEQVDTYTVTGPNAHGSIGNEGKLQTEVFTVAANRVIETVTQECISGPCGWSYNPDGGYDIWVRYYDGRTKVEWKRKHTSHPVTYRINVYWRPLRP